MARDIVPIRLSLTAGDFVTLWAPRWREDGEEWEAFLGSGDALFGFPTVAHLAAFARTATEHDLIDHPAWSLMADLAVEELIPEDVHRYDIIGVPALAAERADSWTIGELSEIVTVVRSLAEVCELPVVHDVLDATDGFELLDKGTLPFSGREGARLWKELSATIIDRWDQVIDELDALIQTPDVDPEVLAAVQDGPVGDRVVRPPAEPARPRRERVRPAEDPDASASAEATDFWLEVGIDPIRITTEGGTYYTLRCYIDDRPLFLGTGGVIEVYRNPRALAQHLAIDHAGGHNLTRASTWQDVVEQAAVGYLTISVEEQNDYLLAGIDADLSDGPLAVDPHQLELAVELLRDAGEWAGDTEPEEAMAESESLGWMVSFVTSPDPTRLAPSPPFDTEVTRWRELVDDFTKRLNVHG